jgi:hypothetical protein
MSTLLTKKRRTKPEQKALSLEPGATERERAYIHALAKRYSCDPKVDLRKLDLEYANAMRELSKHYPDDLDAAALYAESLMDLHPWKLWTLDGRQTEGTEEIVAVLESVLRRDPNHLGHLVHMPAHMYMRVGDYVAAARSNALAADAERAYFRESWLRHVVVCPHFES